MLIIGEVILFSESLEFSLDLSENLKQFDLFLDFLDKNNIDLSSKEDYQLILISSPFIKHIIEVIVKKNYDVIVDNKLDVLGYKDILNKFILCYCEIEQIEINKTKKKFNYSDDDLDLSCTSLFLKDMSEYDLLTDDKIRQLFVEYEETHSSEIRKLIINSHLRLVFYFATKMKQNNNDLNDLIQVGCEALIHAFDNFDVNGGLKFLSYAEEAIKDGIKKFNSRYINFNNSDIYTIKKIIIN